MGCLDCLCKPIFVLFLWIGDFCVLGLSTIILMLNVPLSNSLYGCLCSPVEIFVNNSTVTLASSEIVILKIAVKIMILFACNKKFWNWFFSFFEIWVFTGKIAFDFLLLDI